MFILWDYVEVDIYAISWNKHKIWNMIHMLMVGLLSVTQNRWYMIHFGRLIRTMLLWWPWPSGWHCWRRGGGYHWEIICLSVSTNSTWTSPHAPPSPAGHLIVIVIISLVAELYNKALLTIIRAITNHCNCALHLVEAFNSIVVIQLFQSKNSWNAEQ